MRKLLLATVGLLGLGTVAAQAAVINIEAAAFAPGGAGSSMLISGLTPGSEGNNPNTITQVSGTGSGATAGDSVGVTSYGLVTGTGLNTNSVNVTGTAGTSISVVVTEQGLTATQAMVPMSLSFTVNALTGGSAGMVTFADYVSNTNANFDTSSADLLRMVTLTGTTTTSGTSDISNQIANNLSPGGIYSLTQTFLVTFSNGGSINANSQAVVAATSVPEPASLALLGAGLFGIGMVRRRSSRKG